MTGDRAPGPSILILFGANGDLTWRKLVPALFDLFFDGRLPGKFAILGLDRKEGSVEDLRRRLEDGARRFARTRKAPAAAEEESGGSEDGGRHRPARRPFDQEKWSDFAGHIQRLQMDYDDPGSYTSLWDAVVRLETEWNEHACKVIYFAVPTGAIEPMLHHLHDSPFGPDADRVRLVIEKPFGSDLASARRLNDAVAACFPESSIYRIDHYLGKETVQNIIAMRFANALFEPLWNRNYIDHVQITVSESSGIGHRAAYYEKAGALRDMIQNHLLQLLCLVAMEPPNRMSADEIRSRKADVLHAIERPGSPGGPPVSEVAVRGQYGPGEFCETAVSGYREEEGVSPDSRVETFAAVKLRVANWRWQDVPFYLRTGKRLQDELSLIVVEFRPVPHQSFRRESLENWQPNRLIISIQPQKGIRLRIQAKRPGLAMVISPVDMLFNYSRAWPEEPPEAYETLLLDAMVGDATLFMRRDQIEAAWQVVDGIVEAWAKDPSPPPVYAAGSEGPEAADALLARDGRQWITIPMEEPPCQDALETGPGEPEPARAPTGPARG